MKNIIFFCVCFIALVSCNAPAPVVNNYYYEDADSNELTIYVGEMDSSRIILHQFVNILYSLFDVSGFGNIYECQARHKRMALINNVLVDTFAGTVWEDVTDYLYVDTARYISGEVGDSFKILAW